MDYLTILKDRFGHAEFRPGQQEAIQALEQHGAALAVFPTGGGKTLCYQLPALTWDGVTLVVSPLIALMKDQIDFLERHGIAAQRMDSSLTRDENREAKARLQSGDLKLLYVAPERFNNERFLETMRRVKIALFAVDEAHCISEWGHNFRPDYLKLAEAARDLQAERVLALTATAIPAVVDQICSGFGIPTECAIVTGFYRPNLTIQTTPVAGADRDALLIERIGTREPGPTIVYVTLQKTAERVAKQLEGAGYRARAYHAGMNSENRVGVQEWWTGSDRNIVVATIAFGMGIDKADVRYVYHYNLPKSLESYSQEIGRAGRDGADSTVELLASTEDVSLLENFTYGDTPTRHALGGLVEHLFSQPSEFDVSHYELSGLYDIRPLVLRTALTYMELLGFLRTHTPYYSIYKIQAQLPEDEIVKRFSGERAQLVANIFAEARKGRIWYTLDVAEAAGRLGQDRSRLVRALQYLEQQGWVGLEIAGVRHPYTLVCRPETPDELVSGLVERFDRREKREVRRVSEVLELVTRDGCQTNALVGYFGELRKTDCGHCTWCRTSEPQRLQARSPLPEPADRIDMPALHTLLEAHPEALGEARQIARFLCGLTSPASTRVKLTRHPLFGTAGEHPFSNILAWCQTLLTGPPDRRAEQPDRNSDDFNHGGQPPS